MSNSFLSVSTFVNYINEHKQQILEFGKITKTFTIMNCLLYFEPNESFKNKFNKTCIKPIAIAFNGLNEKFTISHKKVLELFDNLQPIITFTDSYKRTINKMEPIQYLNLSFEQKEYKGQPYYPAEIYTSLNKTLMTKIMTHRVLGEALESKVLTQKYNEEEGFEFMD